MTTCVLTFALGTILSILTLKVQYALFPLMAVGPRNAGFAARNLPNGMKE
jgi:hypothetical protein